MTRRLIAIIAAGVALLLAVAVMFPPKIPIRRKLTEVTNTVQSTQLLCDYLPRYQLLLGIPKGVAQKYQFTGSLVFRDTSREVLRLSIGSADAVDCNWIPAEEELRALLLTWKGTNREAMTRALRKGRTYFLDMSFSAAPPPGSSLWFSGMTHPRLR